MAFFHQVKSWSLVFILGAIVNNIDMVSAADKADISSSSTFLRHKQRREQVGDPCLGIGVIPPECTSANPETQAPSSTGFGGGIPIPIQSLPPNTSFISMPILTRTPDTTPPTTTSPATSPPTPATTTAPPDTIPTTTTSPTPTSSTIPPTLPTTAAPGTIFHVDYKAKFKRVLDKGCQGPGEDIIEIQCISGDLEILSVSHPTIACTPPQDSEVTPGSQYSFCQTLCQAQSTCGEVYYDQSPPIINGSWMLDNDIYAEINFRCFSDNVNGVDAVYFMYDTSRTDESGSCQGGEENYNETNNIGRNFAFSELHVYCNDTYSNKDGNGTWTFVNDDAYVECDGDSYETTIDDEYACVDGLRCGDTACTVSYGLVAIDADHHRFHECIQTNNDSPAPWPEIPDTHELPQGVYRARFRLDWWTAWETESGVGSCSEQLTGVRVTCPNGEIELIESHSFNLCEVIGNNTVECQEAGFRLDADEADLDAVIYECISSNDLPHTHTEYLETLVSCDTNGTVYRVLNLAVFCGDPGNKDFAYEDWVFECGKQNQFALTTDDVRFSCISEVDIVTSTSESNLTADSGNTLVLIDSVEAETDYRWTYFSTDRCYSFRPDPTAMVTKTAVTSKHATGDPIPKQMANVDQNFSHTVISGGALSAGLDFVCGAIGMLVLVGMTLK